jgi:hypothetical protein
MTTGLNLITFIVLCVELAALYIVIVMITVMVWNKVVIEIYRFKEITFLQAFGLHLLCDISLAGLLLTGIPEIFWLLEITFLQALGFHLLCSLSLSALLLATNI